MRRFRFFPLVLPIVFGCGGNDNSGSNNPAPAPYADPFLGRWSGTWQQRGTGGRGGTLTVEIARIPTFPEGGRLTGTVVDSRLGQGTATGGVWDDGLVRLQLDDVSGDVNQEFHMSFVGDRAFSIDERGHLIGAIRRQQGDLLEYSDLDLSPVTP